MIYTITTRTRKRGINFEPHELRPLGISEGSSCWGIWVEGRGWEERTRLDTIQAAPWTDQQSPHLMVSPLEASAWPRAFTIQILLARRRFSRVEDAAQHDSFYGVTDALARFGVNVLFAQTAQVGYDLISFIATCELPRLRELTDGYVLRADQAGAVLAATRKQLEHERLAPDVHKERLKKAEDAATLERAAAFQALGGVMIPRLAELEARLLFLEHLRYRWSKHPEDQPRLMAASQEPEFFELAVGEPADKYDTPETRDTAFRKALSTPWFCNSKIVEAGENSYYLSYDSVTDRAQRRKARLTSAPGNVQVAGKGELNAGALATLYHHTLEILKKRPLNPPFDAIVLPSSSQGREAASKVRQSGTAERLQDTPNSGDYEDWSVRNFFQRQSLMPVRIAALPSLAYARFWAFGGASGPFRPVRFRFERNLLGPVGESAKSVPSMKQVFAFLNGVTRTQPGASKGEFGPQAAVFATFSLRDQFLRLRFARERVEETAYLTFRLGYSAEVPGRNGVNSQGLLREVVLLVLGEGFRVERAEYRIMNSRVGPAGTAVSEEEGRFEIIAKAVTPSAYAICQQIADEDDTDAMWHLRDKWWRKLEERLEVLKEADKSIPLFVLHPPKIEPGFAPLER